MSLACEQIGVLLIGHGTRSARGAAEFLHLAREVEGCLAPRAVEPAFLELAEPTIADSFGRLIARGVRQVVAAPLLLFAAGHAKEDIPTAVRAAADILPPGEIEVAFAQPLGSHPALLERSRRQACRVLRGRESLSRDPPCLLLVGRGSRDPEAIAATHDYAYQLQSELSSLPVRVAFLAMAEPSVASVAEELSQANLRRIVVQPHLLFHGELYESLAALVRLRSRPGQEWLLAPYLAGGPPEASIGALPPRTAVLDDTPRPANGGEPAADRDSRLLLTALLDRIEEAMPGP